MRILATTLLVVVCALSSCKKQKRGQAPAPATARPSASPPVTPPLGPIPIELPAPPGTRVTVTISMSELVLRPNGGNTSHFALRPDGSDDLDGFAAALPSPPAPDSQALIEADGDVTHRRVVAVLDALKQRGFTHIAFSVVK